MSGYEHAFTWNGDAKEVIVTGTFDNWSSSVNLPRVGPSQWEAKCTLPFGQRVLYKFVVDGAWRHSALDSTDLDDTGILNNVLETPALHFPSIPLSEPLLHTCLIRNVEIVRWDGHRLDVLAGAHTNPSLTFPTLRRLLGLVVNVQGGYKLGKLSSTSNWKDRGYYEVASIGDERERGLDAGFYVLLQPVGIALPSLRPPLASLLHSHFSTAPSSSAGASTDSFSTALDTSSSFSFSNLGSTSGEYVRVLEVAKCWKLGDEGERWGVEKVKQAWFQGKIVFDPSNGYLPLSLHPSTIPLLSLRYIPPVSLLERGEMDEYIHEHFLEGVETWVKGLGDEEEEGDMESLTWESSAGESVAGAGSEWGDEVIGQS